MRKLTLIFLVMITATVYSQTNAALADQIISLEKAALERWFNGDVYGFLELSANDVVYFDPYVEKRVDGLTQLTGLYTPWQGQVKALAYKLIDPKVQAVENMAVLTFNLYSRDEQKTYHWNCTEVYRKEDNGSWKIIQTHWSYTKPAFKE